VSDKVYQSFLEAQIAPAHELAAASDILELKQTALNRYDIRFHNRSLVSGAGAEPVVRETDCIDTTIWLAPEYLRFVDPRYVISIREPESLFLPNVRPPFCCIGPIAPGTSVKDLVYRLYDVLSGQAVTMVESDALNHAACRFARSHLDRFPIDARPLKRVPTASEPRRTGCGP